MGSRRDDVIDAIPIARTAGWYTRRRGGCRPRSNPGTLVYSVCILLDSERTL